MRVQTGFRNVEKEGVCKLQQVVDKETNESSALLNGEQANMVERVLILLKPLHGRSQPLGNDFVADAQTVLPTGVALTADA